MSCLAFTRSGKPCRFRTRPGDEYCLNHRPTADTTAAARRAAVGKAAAAPAPPAIQLLDTAMGLYDRASIQAAVDSVIRLVLSGQVTAERARAALRGCAIAARNFDVSDTLAGRTTAPFPPVEYYQKVRAVLSSIDPMLARAAEADAAAAAAGEEEWLE